MSYLKNELSIETSCAYIIEQENILGCFKNTHRMSPSIKLIYVQGNKQT